LHKAFKSPKHFDVHFITSRENNLWLNRSYIDSLVHLKFSLAEIQVVW
jgi:hypothetical protein